MKWFKLDEFRCRCCESNGTLQAVSNTRALVENVLDPARERLGRAITVNSGYRCEKHNREVGGVEASQHLRGEAADICPVKSEKIKVKSELERLKEIIISQGRFDQLIIYPGFLHVSYKRNGGNRRQIIDKR